MATLYELHPENPQQRSIEQIVTALKKGAVMLYPTDTVYAIGCDLSVKSAIEKVKRIRCGHFKLVSYRADDSLLFG